MIAAAVIVVAAAWIQLSGPSGQEIFVNPDEVVSIRQPQTQLLHENIHCTLQTVDGKLINVIEDCDAVIAKIDRAER
jgi:uncharacterized protein YlzI (FlbEa/FlbD family)